MRYRTFLIWNVTGGIVWGAGLTLLGYLLGQISFIREHVDIIFILIVIVSIVPIVLEVTRRRTRNKTADPTNNPSAS